MDSASGSRVAILATTRKDGVVALARGLSELDWTLHATTGTRNLLARHGVAARAAADLGRGCSGGRVKPLCAAVFDGLLHRPGVPEDARYAVAHGVVPIGLVACTFSPLPVDLDSMEGVDIGGPSIVRAAAKNHRWVLPLVDPADYPGVLDALVRGGVPSAERRRLAEKAFRCTESYDRAVADHLRDQAVLRADG